MLLMHLKLFGLRRDVDQPKNVDPEKGWTNIKWRNTVAVSYRDFNFLFLLLYVRFGFHLPSGVTRKVCWWHDTARESQCL